MRSVLVGAANRMKSSLAVEPIESQCVVGLLDDPKDSVWGQQPDVNRALGVWVLEVHELNLT